MEAARGVSTLLLTRAEIAALMAPSDYFAAVEAAFRLFAQGQAPSPPPMQIDGVGGAFHAKGAAMLGDRKLAVLKLNGNFPGNPARGLPTIQGAILLCDAETGALLAIMDSIEITLRRTAAATALAAHHLARPESETLAVIGCGDQARAQAEALAQVAAFRRGLVFDIDAAKGALAAAALSRACGIAFEPAPSLRAATRAADIIVTITTARAPILTAADVTPGAFIAAIGADGPAKSEIAPALMAAAKVVTDVTSQCLHMGDLHHAVAAGAMQASDVYAELGAIVLGQKPGRTRPDEIIVFDSTGAAFQDAASAALAYERATQQRAGRRIDLA